jgi:hypothetical protein
MAKDSDIDLTIVGRDKNELEMAAILLSRTAGAKICRGGILLINARAGEAVTDHMSQNRLFSGIFFGDREIITRIQLDMVSSLTEAEWDFFRLRLAYDMGSNLYRAVDRNLGGTSPDGLRIARQMIALNTVPPPYQETKALLEKRMRKIKAKGNKQE